MPIIKQQDHRRAWMTPARQEQAKKHSAFMKKNPTNFWLGKQRSSEDKLKMAQAKKGKKDNETNRWLGDSVGYSALHDWVYRKLGAPDTCENCMKSGLKAQRIHWANKSGRYKREIEDWLRLCAKCHSIYDHART